MLVVGADALARAGLAARLAGRDDLLLVGEASPADAERSAAAAAAGAILWDLGIGAPGSGRGGPRRGGGGGAGRRARVPRGPGGAGAPRRRARGPLPGGVAGRRRRGGARRDRGLAVLDRELAAAWLRPPEAAARGEGLTAREREVLALLAEGLANKAIAARLGISEHTAKFHVNAILGKLGAESRAEAIVRAARLGLVVL